jgi:hypothetical protein
MKIQDIHIPTEEQKTLTKLEEAVVLMDHLLEDSQEAIRRLQPILHIPDLVE